MVERQGPYARYGWMKMAILSFRRLRIPLPDQAPGQVIEADHDPLYGDYPGLGREELANSGENG